MVQFNVNLMFILIYICTLFSILSAKPTESHYANSLVFSLVQQVNHIFSESSCHSIQWSVANHAASAVRTDRS
jgi:hypothetical protein